MSWLVLQTLASCRWLTFRFPFAHRRIDVPRRLTPSRSLIPRRTTFIRPDRFMSKVCQWSQYMREWQSDLHRRLNTPLRGRGQSPPVTAAHLNFSAIYMRGAAFQPQFSEKRASKSRIPINFINVLPLFATVHFISFFVWCFFVVSAALHLFYTHTAPRRDHRKEEKNVGARDMMTKSKLQKGISLFTA